MLSKLNMIAAVFASAGFLAAVADESQGEVLLAEAGPTPCYITSSENEGAIYLTAWGSGEQSGSYRMVVTQRMGGGGFDIVQEGDFIANAGEPVILSDMELDVEASFSAQLSTWAPDGQAICEWNERI